MRAALIAGVGVGLVPLNVAADALREGRLVHLLDDYELDSNSMIHLVYLPNRSLPSRVRALMGFLVRRFGPVPPWE